MVWLLISLSLVTVPSDFAADGKGVVPVKSYEVENAAYKACYQSEALINSGSYGQARDILLQAAASDPTSYSASVHLDLAQSYKGLKSYQQAIAEAETALKFDPNCNSALYTMAVAYYEMGQFDQATRTLHQFVRVCNDEGFRSKAEKLIAEINAFKNLKQATSLIESGRYNDAKPLLQKAASLDPSPLFSKCARQLGLCA